MNFDDSAKSKGVIVFAFNTATVDYVTIADRTSQLIAHSLKLPVTLVTDHTSQPKFAYDQIIRVDSAAGNYRYNSEFEPIEWKNFDRYLAYQLSPYDNTILVDTDYIVLDNSLLTLMECEYDYQLMHHNQTDKGPSHEDMGPTSLPYVWATVVLFKKTERARLFFNLIGRVQRNYNYYRLLYNISERNYRNDFAFAIANNILNGYNLNEDQGIPWSMFTVEKGIQQILPTDSSLYIYYNDTATVIPYQNIHVMDKAYLLSENFKQVVEAIVEPT